VSYLDAALDVAFVDLRPGFIETLVLAIGEVELFPGAVARGDQYVDMGIVGIGMEGVKGRIGFELRGFEPLPGHAHSLVPIHGSVKAQDSPVVAPLTPSLLGVFTEPWPRCPWRNGKGNWRAMRECRMLGEATPGSYSR
jgi:hypothetical protein